MVGVRVCQNDNVNVSQVLVEFSQCNRDILFGSSNAGINQANPFTINYICINKTFNTFYPG